MLCNERFNLLLRLLILYCFLIGVFWTGLEFDYHVHHSRNVLCRACQRGILLCYLEMPLHEILTGSIYRRPPATVTASRSHSLDALFSGIRQVHFAS